MKVVGIIGGIASGKSMVTAYLDNIGFGAIFVDELGYTILNSVDVKRQLVENWSEKVLFKTDQVNRNALADIVFSSRKELDKLQRIIHPPMKEELVKLIEHHRKNRIKSFPNAVILDAAILLEAGWDSLCHMVVFVDTPLKRRQTFAQWRGWAPGELERREKMQMPLDLKMQRADVILDNNTGRKERLDAQVEKLAKGLRKK